MSSLSPRPRLGVSRDTLRSDSCSPLLCDLHTRVMRGMGVPAEGEGHGEGQSSPREFGLQHIKDDLQD